MPGYLDPHPFQYQVTTKPVLATPETVTESRWHQPWSEPVRTKINPRLAVALAASGLFFVGPTTGEAIFADKWFRPLSEPVRIKPGLLATEQHFFEYQPSPVVSFSWYNWFSEPVRTKPGLPSQAQHYFEYQPSPVVSFSYYNWLSEPVRKKPALPTTVQHFFEYQPSPVVSLPWFGWLSEPVRQKRGIASTQQHFVEFFPNPTVNYGWPQWLSEPVRVKPRLIDANQQALALHPFTPVQYTASLQATETKDRFLAALKVYNAISAAYVDIHEFFPDLGAFQSIVETVQITATININEGVQTLTSGTPVTSAVRANVSIVVT